MKTKAYELCTDALKYPQTFPEYIVVLGVSPRVRTSVVYVEPGKV